MNRFNMPEFLSLARRMPEDPGVPYAFEKRVMACLRPVSASGDSWAPWSRLLWKAAAACLAVSLCTGVLASLVEEPPPPDILSAELERTVFAPIALDGEGW